MMEQEWLASNDPVAMLRFLTTPYKYKPSSMDILQPLPLYQRISDRKLRLFADACREHFYGSAYNGGTESHWEYESRCGDEKESPYRAARLWANECTQKELRANLVRDIFGNPYRQVVLLLRCKCGQWEDARDGLIPPRCKTCYGVMTCPWLTWNDGTVPRLAQSIYDERRFEDMPILADALEDAGLKDDVCPFCKDADFSTGDFGAPMMGGKEPYASRAKKYWNSKCVCRGTRAQAHPILAHCRADTPHVRGCFVIDLLLGK